MSKKKLPWYLLVLMICFWVVVNLAWQLKNDQVPAWDQAGNVRISWEFYNLALGKTSEKETFWNISTYYPPLMHLIGAGVFLALGPAVKLLAFWETVYFVGLLVGGYLLIRDLFEDEWTGLAGAFTLGFMPIIFENSRSFLLDLPMLMWLVWLMWLILKSNFLQHRKYSLWVGVATSGLLLTKWTGIVYLVVPGLFLIGDQLKKKNLNKKFFINLGLILLIVGGLVLPWYIVNLKSIMAIGGIALTGEIGDPQALWSLENLFYYLGQILNFQIGLWPALVFLACFGGYLCFKNKYRALLGGYFLFGYVVFTFIQNKDIRYTIPLLLPLAITYGYFLVKMWRERKIGRAMVLTITSLYLVSYCLIMSFGLLPSYQRAVKLGPLGWIDYVNTDDIAIKRPKENTSPIKEITDDLIDLTSRTEMKPAVPVFFGIDLSDLNPANANLYLLKNAHDYRDRVNVIGFDILAASFGSEAEVARYLEDFDFFVVKANEIGVDASRQMTNLEMIRDYLRVGDEEGSEGGEINDKYELIKAYAYGDDEQEKVFLYRKRV